MSVPDDVRLQADLEFLQLLANPRYLGYLSQNKYLEDPRFLNYLSYLSYWRRPEYAKYIIYPSALDVLEALTNSKLFRDNLKFMEVVEALDRQLLGQWVGGPAFVGEPEVVFDAPPAEPAQEQAP